MSNVEMIVGESKLQVGLDRMVLGIPYPRLPKSACQNPPSQEQLCDDAAKQKEFHAKLLHIKSMIIGTCQYHVSETKNKDLKRFKVLSDLDGSLVCVFSLGFSFGTGVINLEINPSKMTTDNWDELKGLLSVTFDGHYQEFYEQAVVSHGEFCIDVPGENLSSLVLIDTGRKATNNYKGTTYHGRRASRLVGTMYDKAKQLKQGGKLVRVEARINRRDIRFQDLVEHDPLNNPFSSLFVVEVIQLQLVAQDFLNPHLANLIKELGLYESVKNKHARQKILARLQDVSVHWWQPEVFWAKHKELLLQFKPGHAGGFA